MPRAYVRGLSLHDPCFNVSLISHRWEFDTPGSEHWVIYVSDEFYPATSNHYSIDRVFDPGASFHYTLGVPTPAFVNVGICHISDNQDVYIGLNCLATQNPDLALALPPLSGYWRPLS